MVRVRFQLVVAALMLAASCGKAPPLQTRAAALPDQATIAVGATHDVLILACQDRVNFASVILPIAATAVFAGAGRLDAVLYLPGAIAQSLVPNCEPIDFSVLEPAIDTAGFTLEATPNQAAFRVHAQAEGAATFTATALVALERFPVTSHFQALPIDRVQMTAECDAAVGGLPVLEGYIPSGEPVRLTQQLWHQQTPLAGYGIFGASSPRITFSDSALGGVQAVVTGPNGPLHVTSPFDPSFALDLTVYDASSFDSLTLRRSSDEVVVVGEQFTLQPQISIGGGVPCKWGPLQQVTIDTPATCGLEAQPGVATWPTQNNWALKLSALAPGMCRVTVNQPGTSLTASIEVQVHRTFEVTAFAKPLNPFRQLEGGWFRGPDNLVAVGWYDNLNTGEHKGVTVTLTAGRWSAPQEIGPPDSLHAVHGSAADTVFAVGHGGWGARWDGATWTSFNTGIAQDLESVWVNSASDVYAVGAAGTFVHFDGTQWKPIATGLTDTLRSVWSDGPGSVYLTAWGWRTLHWNGTSLTPVVTEVDGGSFAASTVRGTGPNDLWLVGPQEARHFDGAHWTAHTFGVANGALLRDVWPAADGTLYALIRHSTGETLDRVSDAGQVSMPIHSTPVEMAIIGGEVLVLTDLGLLRYRHDTTEVFP